MPTEGEIHPTRHFGIATIFQQPQLLPHLTAEENIILPLSSFLTEEKARRIAQKHLQEMEMEPFGNRYPKELSYGQQQRIAIARALAYPSPLLLMDEPFASLDFITRGELQAELLDIQKALQKTILLVTHQLDEALLLAQRIVVLHADSSVRVWELELPYPRALTRPQLTALRAEITAECRKD